MSLISTSETWTVERWNVGLDLGLDDVSFDADPDRYEVTTGTIQGLGARGELPGEGLSHLTRFSATFTTDEATPV